MSTLDIFTRDIIQNSLQAIADEMFTAMRKNVEGYTQSPLTTNNFATTQVK